MAQDLPPQGGYEPVQYKRNLPARGFRPRNYFLGAGLLMAYGWYKYAIGIHELNELGREKMWSRIYLTPMLQAEDDRDQIRRHWADQDREQELLGKKTKVYHSDRSEAQGHTNRRHVLTNRVQICETDL
ncbi:MAG: hypothetical protein LQ352_000078 [Teloschistes flavicans]|nr:MAG: hypothetical protein LQ352_000078 [Teloschistes flavicans]